MDDKISILKQIWPEWTVIGEIGRGSFGVVYEAVRKEFQIESHSAIKVISIPSSKSDIDVLRSEGMTMADTEKYLSDLVTECVAEIQLMDSFKGIQNIVNIEDYKVVPNRDSIGWNIFIRMELLTPITTYWENRYMSEADVIKLGIDICTALEFCEKNAVIHRDIKPSNIFVNRYGDYKLGDFGIARNLDGMTSGFSQKGTPNYMAPEVEKSSFYDSTVDIYSLGIMLYQYLNGNRLPFLNVSEQAVTVRDRYTALRRRLDGEPLPVPCYASPATASIILKACEPESCKRFQTAFQMKTALLDLLSGKGTVVQRSTTKTPVRDLGYIENTAAFQPETGKKSMAKPIIIGAASILIVIIAAVSLILINNNKSSKSKNEQEARAVLTVKVSDEYEDDEIEDTIDLSESKQEKEELKEVKATIQAEAPEPAPAQVAEPTAVPVQAAEPTAAPAQAAEPTAAPAQAAEPTAAPAQAVEPTEEPAPAGAILHLVDYDINLRSQPTHYSDLVYTITDINERIVFYGEIGQGYGSDDIMHTWYRVYLDNGIAGWIRSDFVY